MMSQVMIQAPQTVQELRARIDEIDAAILVLVEQRMAIAPQLRAAKSGVDGVAAMRPAREVAVLRRLLEQSAGALDADLIIDLWRTLMSANLRAQTEIEVVLAGAMDMVRLNDQVRRYFGHAVRFSRETDARAALMRAVESEKVVAAVPWPGNSGAGMWWPCLTENRYQGLSLAAALPLRGEPEAALFARLPAAEASGGDETLAIAFDPHHRLTRALNMSQLNGRELGRASEKLLFLLEGQVAAEDPRLTVAMRLGLEGLRVIGCFSRV